MDLGQIQVENGCFVEEEGSTYCFCDFNRCNAAGILDLRNLIDTGRQQTTTTSEAFILATTTPAPVGINHTALRSQYDPLGNMLPHKLLKNLEIERDGFIELNRYPVEDAAWPTTTTPPVTHASSSKTTSAFRAHTILPTSAYLPTLALNLAANITRSMPLGYLSQRNNNVTATTTTARPADVSASNISTAFPFKTSYDPVLNNLDQLLIDYLNFSKSVNSYLITESIKQQILKRFV